MTSGMMSGAENQPGKQRATGEATKAGERHAGHGAENRCQGSADQGDLERQERRSDDLVVREEPTVPFGREPAPHRREPRLVEGEKDHGKNRNVEEGVAEEQTGQEEHGALLHCPAPQAMSARDW